MITAIDHRIAIFIALAILFAVYFVTGFAIHHVDRGDSNSTVLSVVFVIIALIANFVLRGFGFPIPATISLLVLVYLDIVYALSKALGSE